MNQPTIDKQNEIKLPLNSTENDNGDSNLKTIRSILDQLRSHNKYKKNVATILEMYENGQISEDEIFNKIRNIDFPEDKHEIKNVLARIAGGKISHSLNSLSALKQRNNELVFVNNIDEIIKLDHEKMILNIFNEIDAFTFDSEGLERIITSIAYFESLFKSVNNINLNFIDNYVPKKDVVNTDIPESVIEKTKLNAWNQYNEAKELLQKYRGAQLRHLPENLLNKIEFLMENCEKHQNGNPKLSYEYAKMASEVAEITINLYKNPNIHSELMRGKI